MPTPSSFDDLDTNPNNNSPQGSENVGPNANAYIQALSAFIKQIYTGTIKPTAAVNFNAQKITNLANGTVSSTSKDAVTGAQLQGANKVGDVKMWHGAVANIASVQGPGWQLADGTNGTADLRDKFVVAVGTVYAPGVTGGSNTIALGITNLPAHNHGVNETPHVHGAVVNDPQHDHAQNPDTIYSPGLGATTVQSGGGFSLFLNKAAGRVGAASTGISVGINPASTGISTQNTGSGTAFDNRPPYYALCFLEYTGIGA